MSPLLTILITEFVGGPDAALTGAAVYAVDESETLGLGSIWTIIFGVAQKTRGHTGPEGEDEESDQVAHGHGAAASLVEGRPSANIVGVGMASLVTSMASGGDVEENDEKGNGARDVDERIQTVDPVQDGGMSEEPLLKTNFEKDVQALLEVNNLESMLTGDIDSALDEGQCSEGAPDLVDPVEEKPVPNLDEERELL